MHKTMTAGKLSTEQSTVLSWIGEHGIYVAFLALVLFNIVVTTNFATTMTFWNMLVQVVPIVLVSLGMALVVGTGGIDISVGSVMAIGSAVIPLAMGYGWGAAILCALATGLLFGLFNGILVAYINVQPIVATLALLVGGRGLAQVLVGGHLQIVENETFLMVGRARLFGIPVPVVLTCLAIVIIWFVVSRTTFGRYITAVGANRQASFLSGNPVRMVILTVYGVSGMLAATAGIIATGRLAASDPANIGLLLELDAIAAVVVGGTPLAGGRVSVFRTVVGALFVQVITATFIMNNLRPVWAQVLLGIIIVIAVLIQRRGRMVL